MLLLTFCYVQHVKTSFIYIFLDAAQVTTTTKSNVIIEIISKNMSFHH